MSLADDVLAILPKLRAEAESLMVDECQVHRPGDAVTDYFTGQVTTPRTLIYEGRCKVQQTISQAGNASVGGHQFTVQDSRVDFPVSVGPLQVDDVVTLTASVMDPQLAGRVFRIGELFHKSFATAQRTRVEEVVA